MPRGDGGVCRRAITLFSTEHPSTDAGDSLLEGEEAFAIEGPAASVGNEASTAADGGVPERHEVEDEPHGGHAVAVLVAVAAILAAILGARSAILASDASDAWQSAVRQEVKRDAALVEDVRFTFGDEARNAFRVAQARVRSQAYQEAAATAPDPVKAALATEASALDQIATALTQSAVMASDPKYALPDGGFDTAKRLADVRAEQADLLAVNPDTAQEEGDADATKSTRMLAAAIVVAFALLFGAVAEVYVRRRRLLVIVGTVALVIGAIAAAVVELGVVT
jgi:hypothetical protein